MTGSHEDLHRRMACNLSALDAGQRSRRAELAALVRANTTRTVECPNGYELHLRRNDEVLHLAEELVVLEKKCCSFLALGLRRDETTGDTVLTVSGSRGAKEFIAAELGVVDVDGDRA